MKNDPCMHRADICGPLDVGDVRRLIPTGPVPHADVRLALSKALTSSAFDRSTDAPSAVSSIVYGIRTVAKVQHREHERLSSALWFEKLRSSIGIPAPALLDAGIVDTPSGARWWLILERIHGSEDHQTRPERQQAVGAQLRIWHESAPPHGLRLDDPGGLGVLLGTPRFVVPDAYLAISHALAEVCEGQLMTSIHGDMAVGHNTIFREDDLVAILDPGAVHVAPPMLDLAWCLAVDLPHGAYSDPLLDGYGRDALDFDTLNELLPHMLLRRLVDALIAGNERDSRWLTNELHRRAPNLLDLVGLPEGIHAD